MTADSISEPERGIQQPRCSCVSECPQKCNTPLHCTQEPKDIDMQIPCVIEGYYHNALYLVYYSYSNGQV